MTPRSLIPFLSRRAVASTSRSSTRAVTRLLLSSSGRCLQQCQDLPGGKFEPAVVLSAATGGVLLSAVEPVAFQDRSLGQGPDGMAPGPLPDVLDAVAEDVLQPLDLRGLLAADHDRLITPLEDLLPPARQPAHLSRQLRVEVPHELAELAGVVHPQGQVEMVGKKSETADLDRVETLRPGESPDDDLVHRGTGTEQETAVERPAGHLHQRASFWNEAESSAHAHTGRKKGLIL